jgi:predicted MFS family arabinose efflux permease
MAGRLRQLWSTPAGQGFLMLAAMSAAYGFAYNAQNNVVTNFFEEILHFEGPMFGYITAIREVGGLFLIILMALFYRVSLQRITAAAMIILGIGFGLFGISTNFATVIPWILITSFSFHTVLQTQYALALTLTTQSKSGHVLGRMNAFAQGGTLVALVMVFFLFQFDLMSFKATFILLGIVAGIGGIVILRFPHLHEGELRKVAPKREPIVWRKDYRYYYYLNLLDGVRQQVFFSFGLWVLVHRFGLTVAQISLVMITITIGGILSSSYVGRLIDRLGEKRVLQTINIAYVFALAGYALSNHVALACFFYVVYAFIVPFSPIGAATYLRKIAVPEELAPSLAMGVTILHATAVVVPVAAGFILNFVGYQIPFFIACVAAIVTVFVTMRLNPKAQRTAARVALDEAHLVPEPKAEVAITE